MPVAENRKHEVSRSQKEIIAMKDGARPGKKASLPARWSENLNTPTSEVDYQNTQKSVKFSWRASPSFELGRYPLKYCIIKIVLLSNPNGQIYRSQTFSPNTELMQTSRAATPNFLALGPT